MGPDQKLYCETDFMELHAKICAVCNDVIRGKAVTTQGGKSYHSEHFICVCEYRYYYFDLRCEACGTPLVGKQYKVHKETELIYCPTCLEKEVATLRPEAHPCAMCGEPIIGNILFCSDLVYRCLFEDKRAIFASSSLSLRRMWLRVQGRRLR